MSIESSRELSYAAHLRQGLLYDDPILSPLKWLSDELILVSQKGLAKREKVVSGLDVIRRFIGKHVLVIQIKLDDDGIVDLFNKALESSVSTAVGNALKTQRQMREALLEASLEEMDRMANPFYRLQAIARKKVERAAQVITGIVSKPEETPKEVRARGYIEEFSFEKDDLVVVESPETISQQAFALLEEWEKNPSVVFQPPLQDPKSEKLLNVIRNVLLPQAKKLKEVC